MALTSITPNMLLIVPTPEQQLGPQWATDIVNAFSKIDLHDHTTGKGIKIPTAGLNINDDLDFQNNDAKNLRSTAFQNSVAPLPNSDIRSLYASGGNLFYNNSDGTPIQLTTGTSINTGALAINVWTYQSITSNTVIPSNASYIYLGISTTSPRAITLPTANAVTAGRFFVMKDRTGNAATNNITINPAGTNTINNVNTPEVLSYANGTVILVSDGISNWMTFKEGAGSATISTLGTIRLAGDLAGTGSTANTPRVVDATASVKGKIQLAGDFNGDGSSAAAPAIGKLTGISGAVSMGSAPGQSGLGFRVANSGSSTIISGITGRNNTNTTDIKIIGVDGFNRVQVGDTATISTLNGGIRKKVYNLSGSGNYNLDSAGSKDNYVFCNPTGALSIGLPAGEVGRTFTIKDISGNAENYNISVYCAFDSKAIEGISVAKIITVPYGCINLIADQNGNWWMV